MVAVTAVSMVEKMVGMSAGKLVARKVACWVVWPDDPMAAMMAALMVAQMAANSVCWWVDSMVE